jgi:hypothetical protein
MDKHSAGDGDLSIDELLLTVRTVLKVMQHAADSVQHATDSVQHAAGTDNGLLIVRAVLKVPHLYVDDDLLIELFELLDVDGGGSIDMNELMNFIQDGPAAIKALQLNRASMFNSEDCGKLDDSQSLDPPHTSHDGTGAPSQSDTRESTWPSMQHDSEGSVPTSAKPKQAVSFQE